MAESWELRHTCHHISCSGELSRGLETAPGSSARSSAHPAAVYHPCESQPLPPTHLQDTSAQNPLGALGDGSLGDRKCLHNRAGLLHQPRTPALAMEGQGRGKIQPLAAITSSIQLWLLFASKPCHRAMMPEQFTRALG